MSFKQKVADRLETIDKTDPTQPATLALLSFLLELLSPTETKVYEFIRNSPAVPTSRGIADGLGMELNHVGNITKVLRNYGLIQGEVITNDSGLFYKWHIRRALPGLEV